jgi:flavin-dependent dehydrogenase
MRSRCSSYKRQFDQGLRRDTRCRLCRVRNDIERHYLRTLDRCGDLGERLRCGQCVERIRTTPDLPNHVCVPCGPGWALVGDAGLVMDPVSGLFAVEGVERGASVAG